MEPIVSRLPYRLSPFFGVLGKPGANVIFLKAFCTRYRILLKGAT